MKTHTNAWAALVDEYKIQRNRHERERVWAVMLTHCAAVLAIVGITLALSGNTSAWFTAAAGTITCALYALTAREHGRAARRYRQRIVTALTDYWEDPN